MNTRKLIAHGSSSLTVALPHKWIKKYGLQKGDEVNVEESDQGLLIKTAPSVRKKDININLVGNDWPSVMAVLTTVYRRGYDEVNISYESPEEYQNISTAVRSLLGYAIMENRKGKCLIKSLPTNLEQDFPTLLRRVFLILLQQVDDLSEILSSKESIKQFYHRDADLNSIVNLAIRMINKGHVQDHFEELHLFHALLILEECGDDLTKFTIEIQNYKETEKLKEFIQSCSKMLRLLYDGYFQKNIGVKDFYDKYYLYWPEYKKSPAPLYELFAKNIQQKPIFYLRSFIEKIVQLAEILLLPQTKQTVIMLK